LNELRTDAVTARLEFRILGPLEVLRGGARLPPLPRKQRALLALLLLSANRVVSADRLVEELWSGGPPPGAPKSLRSYISRLRAFVAEGALLTRPPGYLLAIEPDQLDAQRFERLVAEGREALDCGNAVRAAERFRVALALWRGSALADVPESFAQPEASRLEELRLEALEERIEADLECGREGELVGELEALVAEQPLRERLWGQLMTALYRAGRQADALAAYRRVRGMLADELGLEPGDELRACEQRILRHELAPSRTSAPPHNLPAQLTSFVGRERELEELERLLGEARLVTLTGVGGCGKTRLALEVAACALPTCPDGVFLVELAGLANGDVIPHAIATALRVQERSERPVVEVLADRLRGQALLLVLDNCEHLLEACAELARRLLAACSQLRILATSRAPLGVLGEVDYRVLPLALPERAGENVDITAYAAVRLFVERAADVRGELARTPEALSTVASICRELDGLPLALELAAARTRALTVGEIAARLDDRFRFLRYWRRSPEPRHQTLGATMAWSYDLLTGDEQALLRRLAVFASGFSLKATGVVCLDGDQDAAMAILTGLVDASLVLAEPHDGTTRYHMVETVRQYGAERLDEAGETEATRRRHAEYLLELAEQAWQAIDTPGEGSWFTALEVEHDNLRAALGWSLDEERHVGVRLARALGCFWRIHGHLDEGRSWLERALLRLGDEQRGLRGDLLGWLGHILVRQNQFARAIEALEQAVELTAETGAKLSEGRFLHFLAFAWRHQGEFERARDLLERALEVRQQIGDAAGLAWSTGSLADIAALQGRTDEAADLYERGWALVRAAGTPPALAVAYTESRADLALLQGDVERGERLAEEGLRLARELGDTWHVGLTLNSLARAARKRADNERATALLHDALQTLWGLREMWSVAETLEIIAGASAERGDASTGARLHAAAAGIRKSFNAPLPPAQETTIGHDIAALRSQLDPAEFDAAWAEGVALTAEQAVACGLEATKAH
jgi:predicted ATPase/DNA-binding SARP family transcriptional activator